MANTALDTIDVETNTFRNWVDKTNEAIEVLRNQAVTVTLTSTGDTVTGNGFVVGTLGANVMAASTLRGGSVDASANLNIISNTNITAAYVNVVANTLIYANSTVAVAVFGGNSTATNTTFNSRYFNINSNVALTGSSHTATGNFNFDNGVLFVDGTNNRIGVNTINPGTDVTVNGSVSISSTLTVGNTQLKSNSVVLTNTLTQTAIDSFATSSFRAGKYIISITDNDAAAGFQTSEVLIMQDGTNAYVTEYAVLRNGSNLGTFAADVSAGNARLLFTPAVGNSTIKILRTLVGV